MSAATSGVTLELFQTDDCVETRLWVGTEWVRIQKSVNMLVARARIVVLKTFFSEAFRDVDVAVVETLKPAKPKDDHPRMF